MTKCESQKYCKKGDTCNKDIGGLRYCVEYEYNDKEEGVYIGPYEEEIDEILTEAGKINPDGKKYKHIMDLCKKLIKKAEGRGHEVWKHQPFHDVEKYYKEEEEETK